MSAVRARWMDLGTLDPLQLHATAQGVAEAQDHDSAPAVIWARASQPHVCLGASQGAEAELDLDACRRAGVEVVRRSLGGGTVWVDGDQWCFFLVLPKGHVSCSRAEFFHWVLAPALATYYHYGLYVERVGRGDLWLDGRKILGSGAATVNRAHILGASFLLAFPAQRFAALLRCPSSAYRQWLHEELGYAMTAWCDHAPLPDSDALTHCFRRHVETVFGWSLHSDTMTNLERDLSIAARSDVADVRDGLRGPCIPGGVKLNHHTYLVEGSGTPGWVRLVLRRGKIGRIALSHAELAQPLLGQVPSAERLEPILTERLPRVEAAEWARFIEYVVQPARSSWHD